MARGAPMVDVFRINTGNAVGSFSTCDSSSLLKFDGEPQVVVGTHNFVGSAPMYQLFLSPDQVWEEWWQDR